MINILSAHIFFSVIWLILTPVFSLSQSIGPQTSSLTATQIITQSLSSSHKFPVQIHSVFSQNSDVTVVVVSCNKLSQLRLALNSFFHYNTYPLQKVIIIDHCKAEVNKIWQLLPSSAKQFSGVYFDVIVNVKMINKFKAIDMAYKNVNTKYVYYFQDSWAHSGAYGFLERMRDVIADGQIKGVQISRVMERFGDDDVVGQYFLGEMMRTSKFTKYYVMNTAQNGLKEYGQAPHFFNFQRVYKYLMKASYIETVSHKNGCALLSAENKNLESVNENSKSQDDCIMKGIAQLLQSLNYKQIYVQISNRPLYQKISENSLLQQILNFEGFNVNQQQIIGQNKYILLQILVISGILLLLGGAAVLLRIFFTSLKNSKNRSSSIYSKQMKKIPSAQEL